ncbi:protein kinase domain protein [Ichthyophthirius multifiliis]|uniref:Calcium-dependent protein kinase 1 n=1 Tax=Ichthyophthirius multifiliis TaxID=5932 RepID=G0QZQ7_ICHMU|nr:protein kinase domain protein [Ichthyophthirius multifiliis]EGR29296.1 protein kinase domain protein [Ichthyophthirius multifiliis]|eukprot:XP_004030532.1 protein kinase domain protein [Ichthyophthirius multifiliis]
MAADYMKQILSAVVYCHSNNIVHRDLKPENLLFDSDKKNANLKVIDFGTSRKIDKSKKMTKLLGTPYYIAPEVLNKSYDEKCDVWSCGIILFISLCGYPPFSGRNEDEILKKVKIGKFKFDPEDWDHISNDAKQLIQKMLTYDPKKRITALQALNDQWVQKNAPSIPINQKSLQNLAGFYTRSKIKQAIMTFIASQMVSQNDKEELQKSFRSLDINGDGILSKDELVQGYFQVCGDKEKAIAQVEKILAEVDTNNSGKVDFTEFLMAAANKEQILSKIKMEQAFKIFDQDGNGTISKDELSNIMGNIEEGFWKEILEECDSNKDGVISQNEFIDLLIKKQIQVK